MGATSFPPRVIWRAARKLGQTLRSLSADEGEGLPPGLAGWGKPEGDYIVDYEPIYETIEEQIRPAAQTKYLDVGAPGVFWASIAPKEGTLGGKPVRITIANRVAGRWVDEGQVAQARADLAARDGRALAEIEAEITARTARAPGPQATALPTIPRVAPAADRVLPRRGATTPAAQSGAANVDITLWIR